MMIHSGLNSYSCQRLKRLIPLAVLKPGITLITTPTNLISHSYKVTEGDSSTQIGASLVPNCIGLGLSDRQPRPPTQLDLCPSRFRSVNISSIPPLPIQLSEAEVALTNVSLGSTDNVPYGEYYDVSLIIDLRFGSEFSGRALWTFRRWSKSLSFRRNVLSQNWQLNGVAEPCTVSTCRCFSYLRWNVLMQPGKSQCMRLESVRLYLNHKYGKWKGGTYFVRDLSELCRNRDVALVEGTPK